jgi:hypothetical protein
MPNWTICVRPPARPNAEHLVFAVMHMWGNLEASCAEHLHYGELPATLRTAGLHHKPGAADVVCGALAGMAHDEAHA